MCGNDGALYLGVSVLPLLCVLELIRVRHRGALGTYFAQRISQRALKRSVGLDRVKEIGSPVHIQAYASGVNIPTLFCR